MSKKLNPAKSDVDLQQFIGPHPRTGRNVVIINSVELNILLAKMPHTYRSMILDYCDRHLITVPPGFGRNTPGRYAVIRTDQSPAKLVATTWLKQEDVAYYFDHFVVPQVGSVVAASIPILDFKEGRRLRFSGTNRLLTDGELSAGEKKE